MTVLIIINILLILFNIAFMCAIYKVLEYTDNLKKDMRIDYLENKLKEKEC